VLPSRQQNFISRFSHGGDQNCRRKHQFPPISNKISVATLPGRQADTLPKGLVRSQRVVLSQDSQIGVESTF